MYNLKQGIENFTEKYPFLCINLHERDQAKLAKKEETKADDKPILNDFEKKWLYSLSRFPTELIEGKLYLGSVHNANNKKQMQDLKIQSIVEFISYGEQKISEDKIANYNYKNIRKYFRKDIFLKIISCWQRHHILHWFRWNM